MEKSETNKITNDLINLIQFVENDINITISTIKNFKDVLKKLDECNQEYNSLRLKIYDFYETNQSDVIDLMKIILMCYSYDKVNKSSIINRIDLLENKFNELNMLMKSCNLKYQNLHIHNLFN